MRASAHAAAARPHSVPPDLPPACEPPAGYAEPPSEACSPKAHFENRTWMP